MKIMNNLYAAEQFEYTLENYFHSFNFYRIRKTILYA